MLVRSIIIVSIQFILLSFHLPILLATIACHNRFGLPVDWFVAYKLPKVDLEEYLGFVLLYTDNSTKGWGTEEDIRSVKSSIGSTISQYYKLLDDSETFYMLYNDEHPDDGRTDSAHGHAKGMMVFDNETGFLLIHSVPNFPSSYAYEYPTSGLRNGQTFLCITFKTTALNALAVQMYFTQPSIYKSQLPTHFASQYPLLQGIVSMKRFRQRTVFFSIKDLQSLGGVTFKSFAKYKEYREDLYADLVAPRLRQTLFVKTWLNGPGDLNSSCNSIYKVINVLSIKLQGFIFPNSKDHSKWAVSNSSSEPYLCIGDINRQVSQMARSGGTICLQNSYAWKIFKDLILETEACKNNRLKMWKRMKWHRKHRP